MRFLSWIVKSIFERLDILRWNKRLYAAALALLLAIGTLAPAAFDTGFRLSVQELTCARAADVAAPVLNSVIESVHTNPAQPNLGHYVVVRTNGWCTLVLKPDPAKVPPAVHNDEDQAVRAR